jgi:hypothetical protein
MFIPMLRDEPCQRHPFGAFGKSPRLRNAWRREGSIRMTQTGMVHKNYRVKVDMAGTQSSAVRIVEAEVEIKAKMICY